jgi:uncharacterized membrane protein YphA (DoxX/SURF4 family)
MFGGSPHTKLPHTLRFVIFLLRIVIGLTFFYLGFTNLFNPELGLTLQGRSVAGLYLWLANLSSPLWLHQAAPWAFLIIGVCLIAGLFTRLASLFAIVLVLIGYLPSVYSQSYSISSVAQFINDELILAICLLVLIAARAGEYLGLDAFLHFGLKKKEK